MQTRETVDSLNTAAIMKRLLSLTLIHICGSFTWTHRSLKAPFLPSWRHNQRDSVEDASSNENNVCFVKITSSYCNQEKLDIILSVKRRSIFNTVVFLDSSNRILDGPFLISSSQIAQNVTATYSYSKATAMLQRFNNQQKSMNDDLPRWIPVIPGEEEILVSNGWSFLDADESEPISSFDIDTANKEGQYIPKWFHEKMDTGQSLSSLGYDLNPILSHTLIQMAEKSLSQRIKSRSILLDGSTDPPGQKITNNGFSFSGSVKAEDIPSGIFVCALGYLPIFATTDLKPCTATSCWLSFTQPVSNDHVVLVSPKDSVQNNQYANRIEVICAKTGCHLGHYFGKDGGYCINASSLNFIPCEKDSNVADLRKMWTEDIHDSGAYFGPVSWKRFRVETLTPSEKLLLSVTKESIRLDQVALGAGCFWHVEHALSRLPGIVNTTVGFAGGHEGNQNPSYADVSKGGTGYAEVVLVTFDPRVLSPETLFDCFFAMHDPTMVRAHGKRARGSGQYRSCIMVESDEMRVVADCSLTKCQNSIRLAISTEIIRVSYDMNWFWSAEDRHQLYEQRVKGRESSTLTLEKWMMEYARRSASIWGSAETIPIISDEGTDDGMARLMI